MTTDRAALRLPVLDVVLTTALVAWALVSLSQAPGASVVQPWVSLAAAVWGGSLLLRTVAPFAMAVVGASGALAYALVPGSPDWAPFESVLVIGFSIGLALSGRRLWAATLLSIGCTLAEELSTVPFHGVMDTYASVPLIVGAAVAAGVLLRHSRAQTAHLRELSEELAAERESRARDAAAAERNRIARDLHDVISHSVGVMVVQAGAAEAQLPEGSSAREQLQAVRRTGKDALTELRRQLTVLRETAS